MSKCAPYFICFKIFDPESKSAREARIPIWATSQRHARIVATMLYPAVVGLKEHSIRPATKYDKGVEVAT